MYIHMYTLKYTLLAPLATERLQLPALEGLDYGTVFRRT